MRWIKLFASKEEALVRIKEGIPFTVAIDAHRICLVQRQQDFFAFKAYCPHAGASLSEAFCNGKGEVVCPLHGYRFDLVSGREASGLAYELAMYPIKIQEDGLFIGWR